MNRFEVARSLFQLGTIPFIAAGGAHALLAIVDSYRPQYFTPVDDQARESMARTGMRFTKRTSMWLAWLGFNISHGLGLCFFGTSFLVLSLHNFDLVRESTSLMLLAVLVSASYAVLSVRFWFYGPAILTAFGCGCFVASYLVAG